MLFERLHTLRLAYEKQVSERKALYDASLTDCKRRIDEAQNQDYTAEFTVRYKTALSVMERFLARIQSIESKRQGISFSTEAYLSSAQPHAIPKGEVENVFAATLEKTEKIADDLDRKRAAEEYAPILRRYCDLLATMRFIVKNADFLLSESGLPERNKQACLAPLREEYAACEKKKSEALLIENLPCFEEFCAVRDEFRSAVARTANDRLGSGKFFFDSEYRYLIGFYLEKLPEDDAAFAKKVMGLKEEDFLSSPIYFTPEHGKKNIIINAHKKDLGSPLYRALIHNIYFAIAGRLPPNCLEYGYISCEISSLADFKAMHNIISGTLGKRNEGGTEGNYLYNECAEDQLAASKMLRALQTNAIGEQILIGNDKTIYEYNRCADFDRRPLRLIYIDNYPSGFDGRAESGPMVQYLLDAEETRKSGFLFIVGQNIDRETTQERYTTVAPLLEGGENSIVIDITDPDNIKVDGRKAELNITTPEFNETAYWKQLNDYYVRKEAFLLGDLWDEVEKEKVVSPFENGLLEIPLGYCGTRVYHWTFAIKEACHVFIVGGSGYGKTSFIHTFILSTAFKYSPKDVQFYLADWKGSEFSFYKTVSENGGKAIPHIHYLQDKNSLDDFITFVRMVLRIAQDRNALFKKTGCQDLFAYNSLMDRNGGERLPFLFVIIDEYQTMLDAVNEGRSRSRRNTWISLIKSLLNVARSAGIALILCAQKEETEIELTNIQHRVVMGVAENADALIRHVFYSGRSSDQTDRSVKDHVKYLTVKQEGRAVIGRSSDRNTTNIRAAYSGNHSERIPLTLRIADRHSISCPLILGGNEDPYDIDLPTDPPYINMNDPVPISSGNGASGYDRFAFPVYIGVSTADAYPIPLQFTTDKEKEEGFAFYTENEPRMEKIVNSLMLSFLYKTATLGFLYNGPRIFYFGEEETYLSDSALFQSPIDSHIAFCNVKGKELAETANRILSFANLMEQRSESSTRASFTPYLIILRDLEWLESDTLEKRLAKCLPSTENGASSVDEGELEAAMNELREIYKQIGFDEAKIREDALAAIKPKVAVAPPKIPDADAVRDALSNLFICGNHVAIYVVIASRSGRRLLKFRKTILRNYDHNAYRNIVYGTYEESLDGLDGSEKRLDLNERNSNSINICYIPPDDIKTRIYDYNKDNNPKWWRELIEALDRTRKGEIS